MENTTNTGKGFFQKPEGVTGMILIAAAICLGVYFWGTIVPFLVTMASDTLHLVILLAALALIAYCILDTNIRTGFWYLFKQGCRMFTGFVVNIDPIGILKSYIADLKEKREEASRKVDEVAGASEKIKAQIEKNNRDISLNKARFDEGTKQGADPESLAKYTIRYGGLIDMNTKLTPMYNQMISVQAFLEKMVKSSGYLIEQMEVNIEFKELEYNSIRSANKAMKSALAIFKGDPDKKAMFDMALENMADDMAMKVGEMKRAMSMSTDYLQSIDIDQGVSAGKGADAMKNFDPKQFTLLTVKDVNTKKNLVPEISTSGTSAGISF